MKYGFIVAGIAAILSGCCSCPTPCPWLENKPEGTECPKGGLGCKCVPWVRDLPQTNAISKPPAQVATLVNAYDKAKVQHIAFKQVVLDDLAETVAVTDVRRSKTNDDYDRVQVFVKNYAGDRVRIRYRFNWVDNDGVEVRDPDHDAWEKLTIDAGDDATLTTIAPVRNCYDFKLRMKRIQ